jgi:hypothetical protein
MVGVQEIEKMIGCVKGRNRMETWSISSAYQLKRNFFVQLNAIGNIRFQSKGIVLNTK